MQVRIGLRAVSILAIAASAFALLTWRLNSASVPVAEVRVNPVEYRVDAADAPAHRSVEPHRSPMTSGERLEEKDRLVPPRAPSTREFSGFVVTTAGSRLAQALLYVRPRALLPGEAEDSIPQLVCKTDTEGEFKTGLPMSWIGTVVHCAIVADESPVGMGCYTAAAGQVIVVSNPFDKPSFPARIRFDCQVDRAGLLLTSPDRLAAWGEAVWEPHREKGRVHLVAPPDQIVGPVSMRIGSMESGSAIAVMERFDFGSLSECMSACEAGLDVSCRVRDVLVPQFEGKPVQRVKIWARASVPAAGIWQDVHEGLVRCTVNAQLEYHARGERQFGGALLGQVDFARAPAVVIWVAEVDPRLETAVLVTDPAGNAVAGAIGAFDVVGAMGVASGLDRRFAQTGADGWLRLSGLCRGRYHVHVEASSFGEFGETQVEIDVPGPGVRCVLPRVANVRLAPRFSDVPLDVAGMRAWYARRGERWTEATTPRWRFTMLGVIPSLPGGDYSFVVSLPPFVGSADVRLESSAGLTDVLVPMVDETVTRGRLIDVSGRPIAGRWVSALSDGAGVGPTGPDWSMTRTDADGRFAVVLVPGRSDRICVWDEHGRNVQCSALPGQAVVEVASAGNAK